MNIPTDPKLIEAIIVACIEPKPVDFRSVVDDEVNRVRTAIKRATTERAQPSAARSPGNISCAAASTSRIAGRRSI
jgi:hypothetical protein